MNHIPVTAAQKQILRDRTLLLARIMERYLLALSSIEDVYTAFGSLIDVEPDLDVAQTYAQDRQRFVSLSDNQKRTLIEDYRNLAYSPPDRIDEGDVNAKTRIRYAVKRVPFNSDPNDSREIDLYEPLTHEDTVTSSAVTKRRDLYTMPRQEGGTADWFDSAKQPSEWTPKATQDDLFREGYVVKPNEGWSPPLTREQTQHVERIHGTIPDREMIRRLVCPSEPTPELVPTPGPAKPPHMLPQRVESDWSGARVSIVGGDFNGARGKVT